MPNILTQPLPAGVGNTGGVKQIQTSYLDPVSGKSLHPAQRVGRVSKVTLPVKAAAGGGQSAAMGNKRPAAQGSLTNPVVMTLGNPAGLFSAPKNTKVG